MLVSRTEYAPGLGDLTSTQKARSLANKTSAPAASLLNTYGTNPSQRFAVSRAQNKVLSLIGQQNALTQYNKDLAAGKINPAFFPPPAAVDPATLAAARAAYGATVQKSGTIGQKSLIKLNAPVQAAMQSAAPVVSPTAGAMPKLASGIAKLFAPSTTQAATLAPVTPAPSPAQQTAAALVAAQPTIVPSSDAGGGGGGGGGDDSSTTDTTDATLPPTGWAALSPSMQTGIIVGGLVVVGGIVYLIRRRR